MKTLSGASTEGLRGWAEAQKVVAKVERWAADAKVEQKASEAFATAIESDSSVALLEAMEAFGGTVAAEIAAGALNALATA